jgi:hypothetical protein
MRTPKIPTALSVAALVVAVLGTTPLGHAAGSVLPRSSVGTPQLKKSAVTAAKLRPNSVTGAKVADGSITAADLKAGTLPSGFSDLETVEASSSNDSVSPKTVWVYCPPGKRVISVGGWTLGGLVPIALANMTKLSETSGAVSAFETAPTASNWVLAANVVCARLG